MEPAELALARYRTADLRRDARVYRVAAEARRSRVPAAAAPTDHDPLGVVVTLARSTVGDATAGLLHRLALTGQGSRNQVCCG